MRRYVAIGCTTRHDYSFFLPFVGHLWRERIGYEPIFYLIGDHYDEVPSLSWKTKHAGVVFCAMRDFGFRYEFISPIFGVEPATCAQSIRLYAAAEDTFDLDDIIIPSDADLLPLQRTFYGQHDIETFLIASYYSNGYGDDQEGKHYPSCHVSMQVKTWREVMRMVKALPRENMALAFDQRNLAARIKAKDSDQKKWEAVWFEDEHCVTDRIRNSRYFPDSVQHIRRRGQPPVDRLDRCHPKDWDKYDVSHYVDAHSIRPGWSSTNWPRFRPLIEQTMPEHLQWADEYRANFLEAMGCDQ